MEEASSKNENNIEQVEETIGKDEEVTKLMQSLPTETSMNGLFTLVKYQGFWVHSQNLKFIFNYQNQFQARDSDLIISSFPKTGNTWLKALLFAIINRRTQNQNLLLQNHPHELVYFLDFDVYGNGLDYPKPHHLDQLPSPRLFSTHLPYHSLPKSIRTSGCRVLYLTRNPLDTFVSMYYFVDSLIKKQYGEEKYHQLQLPSIEDFLEECCYQEKCIFGPFFDHVVGYWNKSLEHPTKIMFLMYEDIKDDTMVQVKRIAEFVGFPFSSLEEKDGVIQHIIELCSFRNLQDLEVNKNGVINKFFEKKSYFRKGEVGDWTNHFTPTMLDRMTTFMEEKIGGIGLSFKFNVIH